MKNETNKIGLSTVLKSISLENPTYFDYFTYKNNTLDSFMVEKDCFYNDNDTSTELVINELNKKFKTIAKYAKDNKIDVDYVSLIINYGIVCENDFAIKYKNLIELATEKFKSFNDSVDINDFSRSKKLLEAYRDVVATFERAQRILNDTLEDYLFSNLISFRILSVDLNTYYSRRNKKTGDLYIGEPNLVVRENPNELGDREGLFLVNFAEFIRKMKNLGYIIETGDCKNINKFSDYLEGYKNGEFFRISGDIDKVLTLKDKNDNLTGLDL